jgi:hypothetical protein
VRWRVLCFRQQHQIIGHSLSQKPSFGFFLSGSFGIHRLSVIYLAVGRLRTAAEVIVHLSPWIDSLIIAVQIESEDELLRVFLKLGWSYRFLLPTLRWVF